MTELSDNAILFTNEFQKLTKLARPVIMGWIFAETSGKYTTNGANNWLNVGSFDDGFVGGVNNIWNNPTTAAEATYSWMTGKVINGVNYKTNGEYGTTVGHEILSTAGKSIEIQVSAIENSAWSSAHYKYNLMADVQPFTTEPSGVCAFTGTVNLETGEWEIHGLKSNDEVHWGENAKEFSAEIQIAIGPKGGRWRIKGEPANSKPLGG